MGIECEVCSGQHLTKDHQKATKRAQVPAKKDKMAGYRDNMDFAKSILPQYLLDDAINWIKSNMYPEDVFSDDQLIEWAKDWAINNNHVFVKDMP